MIKATAWFSGDCILFQYSLYWIGLTTITTIAGPFGTYAQIDRPERFLLWAFVIFIALIEVWAAKKVIATFLPRSSERQKALYLCILFPTIFAIYPLCCVPPFIETSYSHRIEATVTAFAICALSHFNTFLNHDVKAAEEVNIPRLIQRLPVEKQGTLLRMTARDHYVEVYTDKGVHKLLMRLRDATEEARADGIDGFCVHRSHWVMRDAIDYVEVVGSRSYVHLKDGSQIPIGKKYQHNVVEAGYL